MVNDDHQQPADDADRVPWWHELSFRHDLNSVHHVVGRAPGQAGGNRRARPAANRGWFDGRTRPTGRRTGV